MVSIRPARSDDAMTIARLAVANDMFTVEDSGMVLEIAGALDDDDGVLGFVHETGSGTLGGVVIARPKPEAKDVWDLTMLAVDPAMHGTGIGGALLVRVERELRGRSARLIHVETSGGDDYAAARRFYLANGYSENARVADYWDDGDDLIIFTKRPSG